MKVTNDIKYVGVNDHQVDLFEGQYVVPLGMAYNSYVIMDDKIAIMDTVDKNFGEEWLGNIAAVLGDRKPDYLIVQHMEPDHSANITSLLKVYPDTVVVGNAKTFTFMEQFYGKDPSMKKLVVKNGEELDLGSHVLKFVFAPMVHWPEVLQTTKVLKAAAGLDIEIICPLHGPVLSENLGYYLDLYTKWASYTPEEPGVCIAYTSVYGHTKAAAEKLAELIRAKGVKVAISDLARDDMPEIVEDAFRYDRLVLATTTYNNGIFPFMHTFIEHLVERDYQNRTIAFIENGTWAPVAAKLMKGMFEKSKKITFAETTVTIKSALNAESEAALEKLAEELA